MEGLDTVNTIMENSNDVLSIKSALEEGDLSSAIEVIKEALEHIQNIPLNIAITGDTGAGKSTLVNVLRGLGDEDDGAAETGVTETTMEPTAYSHPYYENVKYWDLPGIGSPTFKAHEYLQKVEFDKYDFFIIIASERFKECDIQLASAIKNMGKRFYFVRSKIDVDIDASRKKRPKAFNEQDILEKIRKDCLDSFPKDQFEDPQVFLIECMDNGYDFPRLQEVLEKDLPDHKKHTFLLSLPNVSLSVLHKKRETLRNQIWRKATLSCTVAALPIPGVGIVCDVAILVTAMKEYQRVFGLDGNSLSKLSNSSGKSVDELKSVIKSPIVTQEINREMVVKLLSKGMMGAVMLAEHLLSSIPLLGSLVAAPISFATTKSVLESFLNETVNDAQRVFIKASEDSV